MKMSAYRTIALTIAFAVIVNAHIVVAHPASMFSSEMLKNMESDPPIDKMTNEDYPELLQFVGELEMAPPVPGFLQNDVKHSHIVEQTDNNVDETPKSAEDNPEALPVPLPLSSGLKLQTYKKRGPGVYHMTICHFKICNMGRKRDTSYQKF